MMESLKNHKPLPKPKTRSKEFETPYQLDRLIQDQYIIKPPKKKAPRIIGYDRKPQYSVSELDSSFKLHDKSSYQTFHTIKTLKRYEEEDKNVNAIKQPKMQKDVVPIDPFDRTEFTAKLKEQEISEPTKLSFDVENKVNPSPKQKFSLKDPIHQEQTNPEFEFENKVNPTTTKGVLKPVIFADQKKEISNLLNKTEQPKPLGIKNKKRSEYDNKNQTIQEQHVSGTMNKPNQSFMIKDHIPQQKDNSNITPFFEPKMLPTQRTIRLKTSKLKCHQRTIMTDNIPLHQQSNSRGSTVKNRNIEDHRNNKITKNYQTSMSSPISGTLKKVKFEDHRNMKDVYDIPSKNIQQPITGKLKIADRVDHTNQKISMNSDQSIIQPQRGHISKQRSLQPNNESKTMELDVNNNSNNQPKSGILKQRSMNDNNTVSEIAQVQTQHAKISKVLLRDRAIQETKHDNPSHPVNISSIEPTTRGLKHQNRELNDQTNNNSLMSETVGLHEPKLKDIAVKEREIKNQNEIRFSGNSVNISQSTQRRPIEIKQDTIQQQKPVLSDNFNLRTHLNDRVSELKNRNFDEAVKLQLDRHDAPSPTSKKFKLRDPIRPNAPNVFIDDVPEDNHIAKKQFIPPQKHRMVEKRDFEIPEVFGKNLL